jgi:hypothetical protein
MAEIQHAAAFHLNRSLTGTDKLPPDPDRHVAEQRAERDGVVAFAGQLVSARRATATALTHHRHLRWNDLSLKCCR